MGHSCNVCYQSEKENNPYSIEIEDWKEAGLPKERWQCWLFPYIRSTDDNKVNVDGYVSNLIKRDVETEYVTNAKQCKYSVSDKVYKIYNHKLYKLLLDIVAFVKTKCS